MVFDSFKMECFKNGNKSKYSINLNDKDVEASHVISSGSLLAPIKKKAL